MVVVVVQSHFHFKPNFFLVRLVPPRTVVLGGTDVLGGQMSRADSCLGGQLSGGTVVWRDTCRGDTCPGGHSSRGTLVGGTSIPPPIFRPLL